MTDTHGPARWQQLATELATAWSCRADGYDDPGSFPEADIDDLRQSGLLGMLVPERLGGMGCTFDDYVRVAMVLGSGSGASALLFNMHASVTGALAGVPDDLARALGVDEGFFARRDDLLRGAAQGGMYGVAISERGAGSRLSALKTRYVREAGGFRLIGHKSTCSGAGHLDAYLVAARDGSLPADDAPSISYFVVDKDAIGPVEETWNPSGMRATASNGFSIDSWVDADSLLGVEGVALFLADVMPEWLVASYAAVYVGVAQAALSAAIEHVQATTVAEPWRDAPARDVPMSSSPWVRQRIGRAEAQVASATWAVEDAGRRVVEAGGDPATLRAVYRAKLLAGDTAFAVAASMTEACGLGALTKGTRLERLLRDARSGAVMPPSSDISANMLGALLLDADPGVGFGMRPW